ncbi:hypothetical protein P355_1815 [Burkholderia cenocepacia KC-01]|nr:hypothetical protein P355_1815 [Burkholderia cenocepacia KC-01]
MCATGGGSNLPAAPPTRYAKSFKRHFEYLERPRGPAIIRCNAQATEKQFPAADRSRDTGHRGVTAVSRCAAHHSRPVRASQG